MKKLISNTNRIDFMDIGKCIAIMFVILMHVLQRTLPGYTGDNGWGSVIILMLAVPPFFFFSGMAYRNKKALLPLGFLYDIIKRAFLYLLPFIWFILLRIWLYNQWIDFSKAWDELMLYPVSGLWACWILLWVTLVVDLGLLISSLLPKFKVLFVSICLAIGMVILIILRNNNIIQTDHTIGYDYFIIYIPIFLVGYLIGPYILKIKNNIVNLITIIIGLCGLIPITIFNHDIVTVHFLEKSQWMMYLAMLCSILIYFGIISFIKLFRISSLIAFFGQFTLQAYFLHLMLLKYWSNLSLANNWAIFGVTVGLFLLCVINTAAVVVIAYQIPFLHFVMFGKHYSRYKFEDKFFSNIKNFCYSNGRMNKTI